MARFKVGDVVVVYRSGDRVPGVTVGDEFTVLEVRTDPRFACGKCGVAYVIRNDAPGWATFGCHHCLRLKRPPDHPDAPARWADVPFQRDIRAPAVHPQLRKPVEAIAHPILEIVREELADLFQPTQGNR